MKLFNFIRSLFGGKKEVNSSTPKEAVKTTNAATTTPKKGQPETLKKAKHKKYDSKPASRQQENKSNGYKSKASAPRQQASNGANSKILKGKLKYFNKSKGYGFIESKAMQERIFVHISDLQNHTKVGNLVEFQLINNEKGYQAKQVKRLRKPQPAKRKVN